MESLNRLSVNYSCLSTVLLLVFNLQKELRMKETLQKTKKNMEVMKNRKLEIFENVASWDPPQ